MNARTDIAWNKLSPVTKAKLENCFKNCNSRDIADHIFNVIYLAEQLGEIDKNDVFRLAFKILNDFQLNKGL